MIYWYFQNFLKGKLNLLNFIFISAITILKKLCNHPDLLDLPRDLQGSEECYPTDYSVKEKLRCVRPEFSGKMLVLDRFIDF